MPQLTPQMVKDVEDAFFLFDYDKDGKITDKEVAAAVRSCGFFPTQAEIKEIEKDVKAIGDKVDVQTLCQFIGKRVKDLRTTTDELKEAFLVFDKQGTGMISVQDLKMSLSTLGEQLSAEEISELTREVDEDGEGMVRIDDIVKLLLA
jgi:calmodulin